MLGIANVTPGHSHSIRYHTESFNSQERTEADHPAKPIGISALWSKQTASLARLKITAKLSELQFQNPVTHCFHDAGAFPVRVQVPMKSREQDVTRGVLVSACALALIPPHIRSSASSLLNLYSYSGMTKLCLTCDVSLHMIIVITLTWSCFLHTNHWCSGCCWAAILPSIEHEWAVKYLITILIILLLMYY